MRNLSEVKWVLFALAVGLGFTGTLDYRHDLNLERERHQQTKERTATYAEAIAACLNETGFVLKDAIVLCKTIQVPQQKAQAKRGAWL